MAKFSTHTYVHDGLTSHSFGPGDEVPEWAASLVGAHVLVPTSGPDKAGDEGGKPDDTDEESTPEDSDGETELEGDKPVAKPKAAAAPDFTGSAPRRRQSRK